MAFRDMNFDLNHNDMENAEEDLRFRLNRTRGLVDKVTKTRQQQRAAKQVTLTTLNIFP